ncbi:hypothetical protein CPLU01_11082 [Colletotrichum plurivorum]|uniref:Uncharacterized protein n=1 Tax=Colletotrichum plurivorum TaxID=2175906 RepID=A0A8H6N8D5_9PEZI|nr:hypothetical protein CPLU01_11082 [Colletotrichum plurivorum]
MLPDGRPVQPCEGCFRGGASPAQVFLWSQSTSRDECGYLLQSLAEKGHGKVMDSPARSPRTWCKTIVSDPVGQAGTHRTAKIDPSNHSSKHMKGKSPVSVELSRRKPGTPRSRAGQSNGPQPTLADLERIEGKKSKDVQEEVSGGDNHW